MTKDTIPTEVKVPDGWFRCATCEEPTSKREEAWLKLGADESIAVCIGCMRVIRAYRELQSPEEEEGR